MIQKLKHSYQVIKKDSPGKRTGFRSSLMQMFFRIGVLQNFVNYTGKHLCWSLFVIKRDV